MFYFELIIYAFVYIYYTDFETIIFSDFVQIKITLSLGYDKPPTYLVLIKELKKSSLKPKRAPTIVQSYTNFTFNFRRKMMKDEPVI